MKNRRKNGVFEAIRMAAVTHRLLTAGTILCAAASVAASLVPPLLLACIIDGLMAGLPLTFLAVFLYFGSLALEGILSSAQESLLVLFGQKMTHALRSEMSRKLTKLPASTLVGQNPGEVVARFSGDVDTVEALFTSGIISMVADACRDHGVPIRVGVNSGSVEKGLLEKYGLCAKSLCESALGHVKLLEDCGFEDICISVKASDVAMTVEANRLLSTLCDYPLHIGVTEAGTKERGILKSAAGIGSLLLDGIGDTIRISLTDAPEEEAHAGAELLRALGLRSGVQFVSCPSCGRTEYDLIGTAKTVEARLRDKPWNITVAVMGCVVNGPGEASHADYGIAGGKSEGVIFKHGEPVARVASDRLADALVELIERENQ